MRTDSATLLRLVLKLDAGVAAINGAAYLIAAGPLEDLLGLEAALTRALGGFLILFAGFVWLVAGRDRLSPRALAGVITVNIAWVIGSVAAVGGDVSSPTTAGEVWILLQAAVVGAFAAAQGYLATRKFRYAGPVARRASAGSR